MIDQKILCNACVQIKRSQLKKQHQKQQLKAKKAKEEAIAKAEKGGPTSPSRLKVPKPTASSYEGRKVERDKDSKSALGQAPKQFSEFPLL